MEILCLLPGMCRIWYKKFNLLSAKLILSYMLLLPVDLDAPQYSQQFFKLLPDQADYLLQQYQSDYHNSSSCSIQFNICCDTIIANQQLYIVHFLSKLTLFESLGIYEKTLCLRKFREIFFTLSTFSSSQNT